jgi:hypothetical protein
MGQRGESDGLARSNDTANSKRSVSVGFSALEQTS